MVPLTELHINLDGILKRIGPRTRMIFICSPNNPTGTIVQRQAFEAFLAAVPPEIVVVVDEAYFEFVRDESAMCGLAYLDADTPVVTLRTFSKVYGLAGLRVGYGIMPAFLAEMLNRVRMPFNVNSLAQAAAVAALSDKDFLEQTIEMVHQGIDFLFEALADRGFRAFPTQANFFLVDVQQSADAVFDRLLRQGVIVRSMRAYGYPNYIRLSVGRPDENRKFLSALDAVCGAPDR